MFHALLVSHLLLNLVLPAEHVINLSKIIGTWCNGVDASLRLVVALEVSLLAEVTELLVGLWRYNPTAVKLLLQVKLLSNLLSAAIDLEREQGRRKTRSVGEDSEALALQIIRGDVAEQGYERGIYGCAVHVSTLRGDLDGWLHTRSEALLGQSHKRLLHSLVRYRLLVCQTLDFCGDFLEDFRFWICQVIIVQQSCVALRDQLASRGVEGHVVETIQRCFQLFHAICMTVCLALQLLLASVVRLVASVDCFSVALDGVVAIHDGVLAGQIGLVKVVCVLDVAPTLAWLECDWGVWTDEHGNTASAASGSGVALLVQRDISGNDNRITSVPCRRFHPGDGVEEGICASVAGVDRIYTLNVGVARGLKELHQHRLARLGLVQKRLRANFESANRVGVYVVLFHERGNGGQGERVDVFSVVAEAHLGLSETNGIFSGANAIELLKLCLIDTLHVALSACCLPDRRNLGCDRC